MTTIRVCPLKDIECRNPLCLQIGCLQESVFDLKDRKEQEHWKGIFKLQEEMGKLQKVLGKLCAAPDGNHWDKSINLAEKLIEEMGDVTAALRYFQMQNLTSAEKYKIEERANHKLRLFVQWKLSGIRK